MKLLTYFFSGIVISAIILIVLLTTPLLLLLDGSMGILSVILEPTVFGKMLTTKI